MEDTEAVQRNLIDIWHTSLRKGTDFDLWGQPVEAIDCYQKLSAQLRHHVKSSDGLFSDEQKKIVAKVSACLDLRSKALQQPGKMEGVTLDDLKQVERRLKNLVSEKARDFPVEVSGIPISPARNPRAHEDEVVDDEEEVVVTPDLPRKKLDSKKRYNDDEKDDPFVEKSNGTLLPPPELISGKTLVTMRIDDIGLKDASQYIDPFITITIKDVYGVDVTASQDSPLGTYKDDTTICFGCDVYLQKPLEYLPLGFAIFFEFKHYKPKKKSISTKCWSFIEKDEIKEGPVVVELYKKPTCYRRKKIHLLTVKPLYLHLKMTFN